LMSLRCALSSLSPSCRSAMPCSLLSSTSIAYLTTPCIRPLGAACVVADRAYSQWQIGSNAMVIVLCSRYHLASLLY
jgi:hypothetical protein